MAAKNLSELTTAIIMPNIFFLMTEVSVQVNMPGENTTNISRISNDLEWDYIHNWITLVQIKEDVILSFFSHTNYTKDCYREGLIK